MSFVTYNATYMGYGKYNIELPKGKASKPFDEMSSEDIMKASKEVMAEVRAKARAYGSKVIGIAPKTSS